MRALSADVAARAAARLADLATPPGALGRLGDLGVWLSACQGEVPPRELGLRLGEGSGAVAAVPVLRSAVALLRDVALLGELDA